MKISLKFKFIMVIAISMFAQLASNTIPNFENMGIVISVLLTGAFLADIISLKREAK